MRKLNLLIPIAAYVSRLGFLRVWCGWRTGTQPCLLQIAESRKVFQTLAGQPVSLCWRGSLHLVRARHKHCSGKSVPRLCGKECVSVSEQKPAQFRSRNDVRRQLGSDQGMTSNVILLVFNTWEDQRPESRDFLTVVRQKPKSFSNLRDEIILYSSKESVHTLCCGRIWSVSCIQVFSFELAQYQSTVCPLWI